MTGGKKIKMLDRLEMKLRSKSGDKLSVYMDIYDSSLARKWLTALNKLLRDNYLLEKNYCFFGFADSERSPEFLLSLINTSIIRINEADIGYHINEDFTLANTTIIKPTDDGQNAIALNHEKFNRLHRYFEELQGTSGAISHYYSSADPEIRWHIRQLNLLCHEYESLIMSIRKKYTAPMWQRPSQLMCWLGAPRFKLDEDDYELFGIETIARQLGGVYVGVNKAIGKHHWEVFNDEGRDSRIAELTTSALRSQTEAAGDFDIEWANDPGAFPWMRKQLVEFREWLKENNFDPDDKSLTIGHPKVGQVDLAKSFGTENFQEIWEAIEQHFDVYSITTSDTTSIFDYHWGDTDFVNKQISWLK